MRIDSHQHFWKFHPVNHAWINDDMKVIQKDFLPHELNAELKAHGFDGCICVQVDQAEGENDFLVSLAKENSFVKGIVGWVDLKDSELTRRLHHWKEFPMIKGFRHIVQGEPQGFLTDQKFISGVKKLGDFNFTYDLLIYHHQLDEALAFLPHVENVKIVIDHMAKPSIRSGEKTRWELNMAAVSTFNNVFCKVSGMVTEANWHSWKKNDFVPYLDEVLEMFGPSRIMYGSDWPVCLVAATYDEQLDIVNDYIHSLSATEQESIMGKNAEIFYNL